MMRIPQRGPASKVTNGELLRSAELAGYDVLLTVDHGIPYQQSLLSRQLSIIVIRSRTNQLEDLSSLVGAILLAVENIRPGQTITIAG